MNSSTCKNTKNHIHQYQLYFGLFALLLSACNLPQPAATMPAAPSQTAMPAQTPTPTLPAANVTCNDLSFYLDPALGNSYECISVPESSTSDIPMEVFIFPAHTELTLQNYPLSHTQFPPQLLVYPVDRSSELLPDTLPGRVSDLKGLISSGTLSSQELPFLPPLPMLQTFYSHKRILSFNGGQGVRFITEYSESNTPISNRTIFYTFQGLTTDGRFWVTVTLPISNPILPADADFSTLPEGYTIESWLQNYNSYTSDVQDALEAQAPDSFNPTLDSLDSLVESITIRP